MRGALILGFAILLLAAFALPVWAQDPPGAEEPKDDTPDTDVMEDDTPDVDVTEKVGPEPDGDEPDLEDRVREIERVLGLTDEDAGEREAFLTYDKPANGHVGGGFRERGPQAGRLLRVLEGE